MPNVKRPHKIGIRLSDEEMWLCEALCHRHGIDYSGVMRKYMLQGAREEGLAYPRPDEPAAPAKPTKKAAARKR